ncbi:hypothetical protein HPULCUR_000355 [Helicostylum pulchrum]|uniref:WKF domain-containing protein n=1 Tax=Helicostylum pulchrum TaxID=562976 RepID=A0ABP9XJP4_9FUNG
MPESVKKVEKKTVVTNKKDSEKKPITTKKTIQKKVITKKPTAATTATITAATTTAAVTTAAATTDATTATTTTEVPLGEDGKPKLTQGQKLLKSMTAQKVAKKALMKGVASTHVSFDDEGNSKVETVIKKIEPVVAAAATKKNKNRPAMKKPEPKKRKAEDGAEEEEKEEKKKETEDKKTQVEKKTPKKAKKVKKSKIEIEESKKDSKQEEALAYVRMFVNDRDSWKFKKVQQIWILSNLYEIPEEEFDNVLEYLKDLQGSAREKTLKEAQEKVPKKEVVKSNTLTGYATVAGNDDDFDAEKLLAQATMAPAPAVEQEEDDEDETAEIKRAKLIINVLG